MSEISSILIDRTTGLVSFGWPKEGPIKLKGIFALVQLCVFAVLRLTGGDQFRPDFGTGFLRLPGVATINDMSALRADITIIIKKAEANILTDQRLLTSIPTDEVLQSLTVQSITQDYTDPTIINIYCSVRNASGQVYNFGIPSIRS